jgi:hypothetical protein
MKFDLIRISTTTTNTKNDKKKTKKNPHTSSTIEILLQTKCFSGYRQY